MRKQYRQNRKKGFKRRTIILVLIVFFAVNIFSGDVRTLVTKTTSFAFYPFAKTGLIISKRWHNFSGILKNKKKMNLEIGRLEQENEKLKVAAMSSNRLSKENEELKALFGRDREREAVLASVTMKPPQSPYDMIVVDAGEADGVKLGMRAIAHGEILIGHIVEVSENASKVKLLSFQKEEISVTLEKLGISAIAVGTGGGNIELKIPVSMEVSEGESIITTSIFPYMIGIVERVESDPNNPFQKIIFRLPININYLKNVILVE